MVTSSRNVIWVISFTPFLSSWQQMEWAQAVLFHSVVSCGNKSSVWEWLTAPSGCSAPPFYFYMWQLQSVLAGSSPSTEKKYSKKKPRTFVHMCLWVSELVRMHVCFWLSVNVCLCAVCTSPIVSLPKRNKILSYSVQAECELPADSRNNTQRM